MTTTPADDEALVEQFARAMFDEWPLHTPRGSPLTYDKVLEMGGDHSGLLRLAKGAVRLHAALTAALPVEGGEDELVERLRREAKWTRGPSVMSEAADCILALKAEITTLKQGSGVSGP
jgi:hypothetical protein